MARRRLAARLIIYAYMSGKAAPCGVIKRTARRRLAIHICIYTYSKGRKAARHQAICMYVCTYIYILKRTARRRLAARSMTP